MQDPWPPGFACITDAAWTRQPIDALALGYDQVDRHGWYANLDATVAQLADVIRDGDVLVDHSGGTGILVGRLLRRIGDRRFGVVVADASPKFLRLALEKFGADARVAYRLLEVSKSTGQVQALESAMPELVGRIAVVACTNAVHLYPDVGAAANSWARMLRPGGRLLVQSGNIALPPGRPTTASGGEPAWIIEDTVEAVQEAARRIVEEESRFASHRAMLSNEAAMAAHATHRRRVFLPTRPLAHYVSAIEGARFTMDSVEHRIIRATTEDWFDFLKVYHEAVLGWVGGTQRIEGRPPGQEALRDRMDLLRAALDAVVGAEFNAVWTYLAAHRPA